MKVLTNNGKRRLGIPGRPAIILASGESSPPLSDAQIKVIKRNKTVARWLDRNILSLHEHDDEVIPPKNRAVPKARARSRNRRDERKEQVLPKDVTGEGIEVHHNGGGWYEVYVNGFKVTDRNVRKDEAEEIAAEYK